jgi:DNA gyrase/topoisomerase IV subunit A
MAKQKKPAPSGRKGGNGAGSSKSIAGREQQQQNARERRASAQKRLTHGAVMRGKKQPETTTTSVFTLYDVVNGTAKTGNLTFAKVVDAVEAKEKDLLLMSAKGQVIRLPFSSISSSGRATQGVRLMRFKEDGDRVASVTLM